MPQHNPDSNTTLLDADTSKQDATEPLVTRAAIFCTDEYASLRSIACERAIWLVPIAGRPMLDRVLGHLADLGIQSADIFVSHHAIETYEYVAAGEERPESGDGNLRERGSAGRKLGSRWGLDIKIIDVTSTYEGLRRLVYRELDEPILIGSGTAMPPLSEKIHVTHPLLFRNAESESTEAWMIVRPERFVGENCRSLAKLAATMKDAEEVETIDQPWALSIESVRSVLRTQRLLLEETFPGQPIEASRVEPGLWIGRNVDLHPSVQLIPPVYIGANCRIGSGVILGPNVSIENHCIIEERTHMSDCLVFPDTFVGRELSMNQSIAGPCFMQSLDASQPYEGIDPFILGPNHRVIPRFLTSRLFARLAGIAALIFLAIPIVTLWWLGWLCGVRHPIRAKKVVKLPAYGPPSLWRTFFYREFRCLPHGRRGARFFTTLVRLLRAKRWPALLNVVSGKVAWVGLRPRGVRSLARLPNDRRSLCMRSKIGLVRLAELDAVQHGRDSDSQAYASEIYYVATASPWFDLRLLWRAIWRRGKMK